MELDRTDGSGKDRVLPGLSEERKRSVRLFVFRDRIMVMDFCQLILCSNAII